MTACVQNLPLLEIPTSPTVPKFYLKSKKVSNVQETKEDFCGTVKNFHRKYPALSSLYTCENSRPLADNANLWSYGTPFLVKLLFTGNLPKSFFEEICNACEKTKRHKKCDGKQSGDQEDKNEEKLWQPKDYSRIRENGRRVEKRILEARIRHFENLEHISLRTEKSRMRTEEIRLKKAGEMERPKRLYLEKMERRAVSRPGRLIKRECQEQIFFRPSSDPVFVTDRPLSVC